MPTNSSPSRDKDIKEFDEPIAEFFLKNDNYGQDDSEKKTFTDLVIIELKRDGHQPSPILPKLLQLRIHPHGFSKYCIGSALTNDSLRRNRIKPRLHSIDKFLNQK